MKKTSDNIERALEKAYHFTGSKDPVEIIRAMPYQVIDVGRTHPLLLGSPAVCLTRTKTIYIDQDLPSRYRLFYLLHELGHLLLHEHLFFHGTVSSTRLPPSYLENEANDFAIRVLGLVINPDDCNDLDDTRIANYLGVPPSVLERIPVDRDGSHMNLWSDSP